MLFYLSTHWSITLLWKLRTCFTRTRSFIGFRWCLTFRFPGITFLDFPILARFRGRLPQIEECQGMHRVLSPYLFFLIDKWFKFQEYINFPYPVFIPIYTHYEKWKKTSFWMSWCPSVRITPRYQWVLQNRQVCFYILVPMWDHLFEKVLPFVFVCVCVE